MNILDDILNKIKVLNVYYITTKDNVETYLYYNNKKLEFYNDYFVKTSSLYLEYKNKDILINNQYPIVFLSIKLYDEFHHNS